jgi:hypothetical protein
MEQLPLKDTTSLFRRMGDRFSCACTRFGGRHHRHLLTSIFVAAFGVWLVACSTSRQPAPKPLAQPQPYTRVFRPDTNTVALQIALRHFDPARHRGPTVWLVGASHIGEPAYYRALQKHLDAQTLVLFEGVNADAHKRHVREPAAPATPAPGAAAAASSAEQSDAPPGIQASLAESLGLVFQLDAIDYDRTNFLNSDLSIQEIARLMGGASTTPAETAPGTHAGGPGTANPAFNYLMQAMDGSSFLGSIMRIGVQFIGSSATLRAIAKLTFIETLGQLKGDLTAMRGIPPDLQELIKVLIEARNRAVIEDLKKESKLVPRSGSIAIFYGTGHMDDMEKRLTQELQYRPAGEVWLTAFSVDLRETGLSPSELQVVQNLIKWQMDQLQP